MIVDLVRVTTRDGCRLDGIWQPGARPGHMPFDAVLLVHGTGGSFYSSTLLEHFADRFLALGIGALRINTRGHDGISTTATSTGGLRLGAAYETVADCRHDLAAWHEWLRSQVGPRIAWLGHSLGAVKCLYAAAHEPSMAPKALLAVSPPRLSYSWYCQSSAAVEFRETNQRAEALVAAELPQELMEIKFPLPMAITAAGYLEKYGPEESYNFFHFAGQVACPTLYLFGETEVANHAAFQNAPETIADLQGLHPQLSVTVVRGADHFYTGRRDEAWAQLEGWIGRLHL